MEPITLTQPQGQGQAPNPQAGSSYTASDGTKLNPTAVALAKAIRHVESGGDYGAVGDKGQSHGAYQFNKDNFSNWAKQYGLDPTDFSPTNQDKVAYKRIEEQLRKGNAPSEVAARWNGARYANGKYEAINPAYVDKVKIAYKNNLGGNQLSPGVPALQVSNPGSQSPSMQSQDPGLGEQLSGRGNDISKAINNSLSGKINPISGIIQGVGALAGGVGDVVNKGLELIPGFKGLEDLIGKGVGYLAKTPVGQSVAKSIQDFSAEHPELADDIGAGVNIATAIPIFKGLGVLKNVAMDSAAVALKGVAEKGAIKDLTEVASRTVGGRNVMKTVPDAVKTAVKERALPNIVNGKYATEDAVSGLRNSIAVIDEKELQPILQEISAKQNFGQDLSTLKKLAIKEAENDPALREAGMVPQAIKQIEKRFEGWTYSYGKSVDVATENRLKIGTGKFSDWGTPEGSADKSIYHALQSDIENVAKIHGLDDVSAINERMSKLIKTIDLFKYINGKAVKNEGIIHGLIQGAAIAGGEAAGNMVGVPIAGAVAGAKTTSLVERSLRALSPRSIGNDILKRTTPGAARQTVGGLVKRTAGAAAASSVRRPAGL